MPASFDMETAHVGLAPNMAKNLSIPGEMTGAQQRQSAQRIEPSAGTAAPLGKSKPKRMTISCG
jgi:hypothetical protein